MKEPKERIDELLLMIEDETLADNIEYQIEKLIAAKDHDHEILVNTILETKNEEIEKSRVEGYEQGIKFIKQDVENNGSYFSHKQVEEIEKQSRDEVLKEIEEKLPKEKIIEHLGSNNPEHCEQCLEEKGFNSCLVQVKKGIKEVKIK